MRPEPKFETSPKVNKIVGIITTVLASLILTGIILYMVLDKVGCV